MKKIADYRLNESIGKGSFGEVYLTTKEKSNKKYATKVMKREIVEEPNYLKYFKNEITLLSNINHKNCVKLESLQKTTHNYYIIMEYCNGGTLKKNYEQYKLKNGKPFSEKISQYILKQIIEAIDYLHSNNIVHRDLKSGNMMLNYHTKEAKDNLDILNSDLKIIDFGTSTYKHKIDKPENDYMMQTVIGSPLNMDPIILKMYTGESNGIVPYNEKIDIWSLGILSYYLFTGDLPFKATNVYDLLNEIEKGEIKVPTNLALEAISLIINMLQFSPDKRANAKDLLNHPFIQKNSDNFTYLKNNNIPKSFSKYIKNGYLYINIKDNDEINSLINQFISQKNSEKDSNITNFSYLDEKNKSEWGHFTAPLIDIDFNKINFHKSPQKNEKKSENINKDKDIKEQDVNEQEIKEQELINKSNNSKINNNDDINKDKTTKDAIENNESNLKNDFLNNSDNKEINNDNEINDKINNSINSNKNNNIDNNIDNDYQMNYLINSSPFETFTTNFDFMNIPENKKMSMVQIPYNNQLNNTVAGYSYKENMEAYNQNQISISKSNVNNSINNNILQISNNRPKHIRTGNDNSAKIFSFADEDMTAKFNSFHTQTNGIQNIYQSNIDVGSKNNLFKDSSNNEILNPYNNIYSSMPSF